MEIQTKYEIKEMSWPEKTFVTKRAKISFDKIPAFFSKTYGEIYGALKKIGAQATEPPCAIYYSVNEVRKETDLAAAIPIQGLEKELEGFEKVIIPKSKVLALTYYGSYENMGTAYAALEKYLLEHRLKKAWTVEEYLSDPSVEKDPGKWKTNIYFGIK